MLCVNVELTGACEGCDVSGGLGGITSSLSASKSRPRSNSPHVLFDAGEATLCAAAGDTLNSGTSASTGGVGDMGSVSGTTSTFSKILRTCSYFLSLFNNKVDEAIVLVTGVSQLVGFDAELGVDSGEGDVTPYGTGENRGGCGDVHVRGDLELAHLLGVVR